MISTTKGSSGRGHIEWTSPMLNSSSAIVRSRLHNVNVSRRRISPLERHALIEPWVNGAGDLPWREREYETNTSRKSCFLLVFVHYRMESVADLFPWSELGGTIESEVFLWQSSDGYPFVYSVLNGEGASSFSLHRIDLNALTKRTDAACR